MPELKIRQIQIFRVSANPWNPNEMTDDMRRAARESIDRFGFIDPITVRPVGKGRYQIIDGEHRWEEAKAAGHKTVPAIVLSVTEAEAKKLTVLLNEIKGSADLPKLGSLLSEIRSEPDFETGLPWKPAQVEHLLQLADVDFEQFKEPATPVRESGGKWFFLPIRAPEEFRPVWENCVAIARANGVEHSNAGVHAGMVLEMVCADFLAGTKS